jgi:predicted  nucleic acid-binding Zn-ribbon protein
MTKDPFGDWVLAGDAAHHATTISMDLDAAKSELTVLNEHIELLTADLAWSENDSRDQSKELAALREELADCKRSNEILRNQRPSEIFEQRLTAAEQRNAELVKVLRDIRKSSVLSRRSDAQIDALLDASTNQGLN